MGLELIRAGTPSVLQNRARAAVGVVMALGYFIVFAILDHAGLSVHDPAVAMVCKWLIVPALLLWAIKFEGLSLPELGLRRPTWATLIFALFAVVTTFLGMTFYYRLAAPSFSGQIAPSVVHGLAQQPFRQLLILGLSAGFVEELVFRFYAISRLEFLTGSPWIASLMQLLVFVGLHLPGFGITQLVPVTIGATVLTGLYWLRRDYWCSALAHCLIDLAGLTLAALAGQ